MYHIFYKDQIILDPKLLFDVNSYSQAKNAKLSLYKPLKVRRPSTVLLLLLCNLYWSYPRRALQQHVLILQLSVFENYEKRMDLFWSKFFLVIYFKALKIAHEPITRLLK